MDPPPVRPPHGPRKSEEHYVVGTDPTVAFVRGGISDRLLRFLFKFSLVDRLIRFLITRRKR